MKAVFSSPEDELPLKSDKYAAICTDLHLGNRGITHLRGFEKFVSLDTVWLNNNELESIEGLERNNRLKGLHLYVNRIKKLEINSFAPFKLLQRITLNDNFLEDLDGTLVELRNQRNLQSLDLFNNPIAKEDNYRMRVLAAIPSLSIFDLRRVTDAERVEVNIFRKKMNEMNQFNVTRSTKLKNDVITKLKNNVITRSDDRSNMETNALSNMRELLSSHARGTRCFMEISFLEIDRRRLGTVEKEEFWRIMQLYGHTQLLNEGEKELLMKRYRKVVKVKAVSATGTISKAMVNYIDFCRDMLPVSQRIIHDSKAWRTERAPEMSVSTAALGLYVRTVREHRRLEETTSKKLSLRTHYSGSDGHGESAVTEVHGTDCGLNPWEASELSRIISIIDAPPVAEKEQKKPPMKSTPSSSLPLNAGGSGDNSTLMTREQCDFVFERFKELGKVPANENDSTYCLDAIFDSIAVGTTVSSILFRAAVGCPQCPRKTSVLPIVRNAVSAQKSRKPEVAVEVRPATVGPVVNSLVDALAFNRQRSKALMKWRDMTERESLGMERAVSERVAGLMDSLLHAKDPSNIATLTAEVMRLGQIASRIGGQRVITSVPKVQFTPSEVTAAASNRADVIVLPNLKTSLSASTKQSPFSPSPPSVSDYHQRGKSSSGRAVRSRSCEMPTSSSSFSSSNFRRAGWAPGTVTMVLG